MAQKINQAQDTGNKLGFAEVTSTQGSIAGTEIDLTGISVAVTVPPGGRDVEITVNLWPNSTVAGDIVRAFVKEGSTYLGSHTLHLPVSSYGFSQNFTIRVPAPSAGAHTYKVTLQRIGGTGTIASNAGTMSGSNTPASISVKLI